MELAINGGEPTRRGFFPRQITIGQEEKDAVNRVLDSKDLSRFRGSWNDNFYGGTEVQSLEKEFSKKFKCKHSIAVNSCTSALQIACGAIGIESGDEVVVTPFSMSCSATAPMIYGGIPVFADVEYDYFCLDPESVEKKITEKTKAIIVVSLFGQPYDFRINDIAKKYNLYVIEDAAQAIGSKHKDKYAGTLGDIGCFSFTQGKHLTAGEGGMITTNNKDLAFECQLIRNHAESVLSDMGGLSGLNNLVGFNMRMTEIQAAIIREQLKKLNGFVERRQYNAENLYREICEIPFIKPAKTRKDCTHSYYVMPFYFDEKKAGVSRDRFIEAVKAELTEEEGRPDKGVPIGCGYIQPLYRMPLFQKSRYNKDHRYLSKLPIVEKLWQKDLFITTLQQLPLNQVDRDDITNAFFKVADNMGEL